MNKMKRDFNMSFYRKKSWRESSRLYWCSCFATFCSGFAWSRVLENEK